MARVIDKRVTAEIEGDFVVFLIGMRINRFLRPHKWLPVFVAMPRMVRELERNPAARSMPAAGRKASAASRAGVRDEPYPADAPTEGIEI